MAPQPIEPTAYMGDKEELFGKPKADIFGATGSEAMTGPSPTQYNQKMHGPDSHLD
jgi:hypothetical protein